MNKDSQFPVSPASLVFWLVQIQIHFWFPIGQISLQFGSDWSKLNGRHQLGFVTHVAINLDVALDRLMLRPQLVSYPRMLLFQVVTQPFEQSLSNTVGNILDQLQILDDSTEVCDFFLFQCQTFYEWLINFQLKDVFIAVWTKVLRSYSPSRYTLFMFVKRQAWSRGDINIRNPERAKAQLSFCASVVVTRQRSVNRRLQNCTLGNNFSSLIN